LLQRFDALTRPRREPWSPRQPWTRNGGKGAKFVLRQPASAEAKAVASGGLNPQWGRAVLHGLLLFPDIVADHVEAIAGLPLAEKPADSLRDSLLDAAMAHGALDPERLNTILAPVGVAGLLDELRLKQGLAFSFTRRDADPERARRDLVLVIETLAARPGLDAALAAATARLKEEWDEAAFQEQQRLREARDEAERQLATLMVDETD
jgi:DNA primase